MGSDSLISILMPVFNVEKYVREAVESLLVQTYSNFELIIVDDCSTDSTYSICEKLANADSRVRVFKNESNLKIVLTLNRALRMAKGSYIARMDGDDVAVPERLENQYNYLCKNPDVALIGVSTISIDEDGNEFARHKFISDQFMIQKCLNLTTLVSHNWLCRREVYDFLGGYRELAPVEDYDFLLRMHSAGYRFSNLPFYGMKIRYRSGNTATTAGLEQVKAFKYVTRLYKERCKNGHDSYSKIAFYDFVKSSERKRELHLRSAEWMRRAFDARKKGELLRYFLYGILSIFLSHHQLHVVARRQLMHFYEKFYNSLCR